MAINIVLNDYENEFYFRRVVGTASPTGYIFSDTWRGFTSYPKTENAPGEALIGAFDHFTDRFESYLQNHTNPDRASFDAFHNGEVIEMYNYLWKYHVRTNVHAIAKGDFNKRAYNAYAKIVSLIHSHWCFRRRPNNLVCNYQPSDNPDLRSLLHVPLDVHVLDGIRALFASEGLSVRLIPKGGMGTIKSHGLYADIQALLRQVADSVSSTNFAESSVSPLAFDGMWRPPTT